MSSPSSIGKACSPPPDECEAVDQQLVCTLIDFYFTTQQPGEPPDGTLQLTVTVLVDDGIEDPMVTLTATSRSNGLDNDPDSTNNVVHLTLTAAES